ncbi:MAG: 30S ribosomal protein S18 [Verrucomicrobiota bacterium]
MGEMSFRDTEVLQRYVTETGKMLPRRITGLTAKQQRHFSREIKRSRNMLLMQ